MIESLLGSKNAERVLIYIFAREEGYAREIAGFYKTDLKSIQMQLDKFERSGVLVSPAVGCTRPYVFNPRYPFLNELKSLLKKALSFYSKEEQVRKGFYVPTQNHSLPREDVKVMPGSELAALGRLSRRGLV